MTDDLIYDYSALAEYTSCNRKGFYSQELSLTKNETVPVLHAGTAFHEALDVLYSDDWNVEAAIEQLHDAWGDYNISAEHRSSHLSANHLELVLRNYADQYRDRPRETYVTGSDLFSERAFEVEIAGHRIGGILDRVEEDRTGSKILVDSKTTSSWLNSYWASRRSFGIDHQLRLYWLAIERATDLTIDKAYIDGIYVGEKAADPPEKWENRQSAPFKLFGPFTFSPGQLKETEAWVEQTIRDIEYRREQESEHDRDEYAWPQNTLNAYGCSSCPFEDLCRSSPITRDGLIRSQYVEKEPDGKLLSGADSST